MAKKQKTAPPSDFQTSEHSLGAKQVGALLSMPFYVPASIINGDLRKAGLGAGVFVIFGLVGVAIYFGIAYAISKSYPQTKIMKYAFFAWLVGILIALVVTKNQKEKAAEDNEFKGGKLGSVA